MGLLERKLMDKLQALHGRPRTSTTEYYIVSEGWQKGTIRYLSGVPYLWTTFAERAFVFDSKAQAARLIEDYPSLLEGSEIMEREV